MIHPTSVIEHSAVIGNGTKVWHFCHISEGVVVGDNCVIGDYVYVGKGVIIGAGSKIQNKAEINEGVTIGEEVFIGPGVIFTNVKKPRAYRKADKYVPTIVGSRATIGAGAIILCGIIIGENSFIGAGSVVVKDVPIGTLVFGNPARVVGPVED